MMRSHATHAEGVFRLVAARTFVLVVSLFFFFLLARDLDAVVAPGLGDTNVIGMNLLSRLKAWRVEDNTLILVPNAPQQTVVN